MLNKNNEVPMTTGQVEVFYFKEKESRLRTQVINGEPWFVAKDVCEMLGISKYRDVISSNLDEDERASISVDTLGGLQSMSAVNESGFYTLIFLSRKPEARMIRKWVTSEVLPSIRKKGYYGVKKQEGDYLDARDIPYVRMSYNGGEVRMVEIEGERWYSLNDVHGCIGSRTESSQSVKRLNAKRTLARKIWLYGVTQPGWFTTLLGVKLLLSASLKARSECQLMLDFDGKEG